MTGTTPFTLPAPDFTTTTYNYGPDAGPLVEQVVLDKPTGDTLRITRLEVTDYLDGRLEVRAYGFKVTKTGARDKRATGNILSFNNAFNGTVLYAHRMGVTE